MVFFLIVNVISIQKLCVNNIALNKEDEQQIELIEDAIKDYENTTGNKVDELLYGYDRNRTYGYPNIQYTLYDTNVRALTIEWSTLDSINYYTGESYQGHKISDEEYNKIFGAEDFTEFNLNDQLKFDGNTAYLAVY